MEASEAPCFYILEPLAPKVTREILAHHDGQAACSPPVKVRPNCLQRGHLHVTTVDGYLILS